MLTAFDLFCGIGGMSLALEGVARAAVFCDTCPAARAVVEANFLSEEGGVFVDDVRKLVPEAHAMSPDIVCAGFPCVGFSSSGKREGFRNSQTIIYYELVRVVADYCPALVFMENVPGVLKNMQEIASDFDALGYDLAWCVISANSVGAVHERKRWFCLAMRRGAEDAVKAKVGDLAFDDARLGGWSAPFCGPKGTRDPAHKVRMQLLGNALVPQAARFAFRLLMSGFHCAAPPGGGKVVFHPPRHWRAGAASGDARRVPKYGYALDGRIRPLPEEKRAPLEALYRNRRRIRLVLDGSVCENVPKGKVTNEIISGEIVQHVWATPRKSMQAAANVLTTRTARDLPTQVKFLSSGQESDSRFVHGRFAEWLMGFPPDWTLPAASPILSAR